MIISRKLCKEIINLRHSCVIRKRAVNKKKAVIIESFGNDMIP